LEEYLDLRLLVWVGNVWVFAHPKHQVQGGQTRN